MKAHHGLAALLLSCALTPALVGCTDETSARRALEAEGFTDIVTGDYAPFACADGDDFATRFTATNARGQRVSGVVCSTWFGKNATVRW